ncbi:hypothetical protein MMC18_006860 [Xylographa bjoerkii]|nr:hypothetical protein [Xylographa bjoerkii]
MNVGRLRPRAKTIELESPKPENDPSKYTEERVRAGKEYATRRLNSKTRRPSPNLEKLLCVYLLACEKVLEDVEEGQLESDLEAISEVRQYELEMSENNWSAAAGGSAASQQLQEDLVELRRLQYIARYGDYTKIMAHRVRKAAKEHKTEDWEEISGRVSYLDLAELLHKEEKDFDKYGSKPAQGQVGNSQAVHAACTSASIDFNQTRNAIYVYGGRCNAVHNKIFELAEESWSDAAQILFHDLMDLSSVMPPGMEEEEDTIRAILLELRDEWFDIQPGKYIEPKAWWPNQKIRREVNASRIPETRQKARVAHEGWVARGAATRLAKAEEEDELIDQLTTGIPPNTLPGPGPMPPSGQTKRKASQETTRDDRKKAWHTIISQQVNAKATFRASLERQREVHRVVSSYKNVFGRYPPAQSPPGK